MFGKTVAITGCTGGLGRELCFDLAKLGANIIMLDRNAEKSQKLAEEIKASFNVEITRITTELSDMKSVKNSFKELVILKPDIFIANAAVYSVPRFITDNGFDNVFQINFVSQYYLICRLCECLPDIKIVAVSSIAHTYSVLDKKDVDFKTRKSGAKVYGNSKRFLMLSLAEYFKNSPKKLAIVHPGITFTNITAHYPKIIFAIIKYPMKIIFMKPKKAVKCILKGIFDYTEKPYWIGPRFFGIWGKPQKQKLKVFNSGDSSLAAEIAEKIYKDLTVE